MKSLAAALAVCAVALGVRFGTFVASGADSYGYVSQADLWLRGTLIVDQPLGREAPWRNAHFTLAPLGYRPGDERGTMVPTYSPGLPILMAGLKALGGERGVYLAVPLLGGLAVWLTFLLGARLGGPQAGVLAALALLASPPFLFHLMWPMSDVPAMAWWAIAIVLALGRSRWHVVTAGLAAAAAILTRPNLFLLAVPVAALIVVRETRGRDRLVSALAFTAATLPGPIAVAIINHHLYGSPFTSGYGTFATLYAGRHALDNLARYPAWLLQAQTPFILLALAAPSLLRRQGRVDAARLASWGLAFSVLVFLLYLWYTPFGDWTYLRFLLPAYPLLLAGAAAALVLVAPQRPRARALTIALTAVVLVAWGAWHGRAAFRVRGEEARYANAARLASALPANAAIICNQHSGSLRYYANRLTLRYEWLDADMYATALAYLRASGRPVYAVLDDWERDVFRSRYAAVTDLSWLDGTPLLLASKRVYFYEIPDASAGR
ncbi:MAG: glycosyltransferase family 39 protein [Acidobacteria bacterium]|nr:glycosyltransferase family 39 protein [Acidobacteriota bacterium]